MTVYLIQQPLSKSRNSPINLEPAKKYGNIVAILHEDVSAAFNSSLVLGEIEKGLKDFNPNIDFICWAIGDPLALLMCGIALAKKGVPHFTWLRYSKRRDRDATPGEFIYIPTKVPVIS